MSNETKTAETNGFDPRMTRDIKKLPKWAQFRINVLQCTVQHYEQQMKKEAVVRADERQKTIEKCAKVADEVKGDDTCDVIARYTASFIAQEIRALSTAPVAAEPSQEGEPTT